MIIIKLVRVTKTPNNQHMQNMAVIEETTNTRLITSN